MKIATDLIKTWNLDFTSKRRSNIKDFLRRQSQTRLPFGKFKGNKAWKRATKLMKEIDAVSYCPFEYAMK